MKLRWAFLCYSHLLPLEKEETFFWEFFFANKNTNPVRSTVKFRHKKRNIYWLNSWNSPTKLIISVWIKRWLPKAFSAKSFVKIPATHAAPQSRIHTSKTCEIFRDHFTSNWRSLPCQPIISPHFTIRLVLRAPDTLSTCKYRQTKLSLTNSSIAYLREKGTILTTGFLPTTKNTQAWEQRHT